MQRPVYQDRLWTMWNHFDWAIVMHKVLRCYFEIKFFSLKCSEIGIYSKWNAVEKRLVHMIVVQTAHQNSPQFSSNLGHPFHKTPFWRIQTRCCATWTEKLAYYGHFEKGQSSTGKTGSLINYPITLILLTFAELIAQNLQVFLRLIYVLKLIK